MRPGDERGLVEKEGRSFPRPLSFFNQTRPVPLGLSQSATAKVHFNFPEV